MNTMRGSRGAGRITNCQGLGKFAAFLFIFEWLEYDAADISV